MIRLLSIYVLVAMYGAAVFPRYTRLYSHTAFMLDGGPTYFPLGIPPWRHWNTLAKVASEAVCGDQHA